MPAEAAGIEAAATGIVADAGACVVVATMKAAVVTADMMIDMMIDMARVMRVIAGRAVVLRQRIGAEDEQSVCIRLRNGELAIITLLAGELLVTHRSEHQ